MEETQGYIPETVSVVVDHGNLDVHETAADFGSYLTYVLLGTEAAFQILKFDDKRARAYITVVGTGPVFIGTESQCQQIKVGAPQTGTVSAGYVATGITVPVTHKQEVWLVPDGTHPATVTVINERWA